MSCTPTRLEFRYSIDAVYCISKVLVILPVLMFREPMMLRQVAGVDPVEVALDEKAKRPLV